MICTLRITLTAHALVLVTRYAIVAQRVYLLDLLDPSSTSLPTYYSTRHISPNRRLSEAHGHTLEARTCIPSFLPGVIQLRSGSASSNPSSHVRYQISAWSVGTVS
eukprot:scaffold24636_cov31-Tisochrysis_lutea.AAC.12